VRYLKIGKVMKRRGVFHKREVKWVGSGSAWGIQKSSVGFGTFTDERKVICKISAIAPNHYYW
jgi:hypothetical protein